MAVDEKKADRVRSWRPLWDDVAETIDEKNHADVAAVFRTIAAMERPGDDGKVRLDFEETDLRAKLELLHEDDLHAVISDVAHIRKTNHVGLVLTRLLLLLPPCQIEPRFAKHSTRSSRPRTQVSSPPRLPTSDPG